MKDFGYAVFILGIRMYRDRLKRLLALSQFTYIDKILKGFSIENSKKGLLPMSHGIYIFKDMCPKIEDEKSCMNRISYTSAIRYIMYL